MKTEPNEPINAIVMVDEDGKHYIDRRNFGLTKREYFAAMAMQGMLASTSNRTNVFASQMAVEFADALINALNR